MRLIGVAIIWAPWLLYGETLTLQQAIVAAEANNRVIAPLVWNMTKR